MVSWPSVLSRSIRTISSGEKIPSWTSLTLQMGNEGTLTCVVRLIISLSCGTPRVTFLLKTPAWWNVFRAICVAGSLIDWAVKVPHALWAVESGKLISCLYVNAG